MKFVLAIVAAVLSTVGAITLTNLGVEEFSGKKAEKPLSYVFRSGINKANELCENSRGILSLGSVFTKDGTTYHLKCMLDNEMTFEIPHTK